MDFEDVIIRVPAEAQEGLLELLRLEQDAEAITIKRVSAWRSAALPWTEILITLTSAGSLTAIGAVIKAWLNRTQGKLEVISEQTGARMNFEGPLDRLPIEQIQSLLQQPDPLQGSSESPPSTYPETDT